ncbi:MAG: WecB/TagA/CpsF family glycosyltransferase [Planctomycetota bacterium]|nr:WecB/TagA/CpsF family glycosyltransferase [Planctomycetota bacterium]
MTTDQPQPALHADAAPLTPGGPPQWHRLPSVALRGARLSAITEAESIALIESELNVGRGGWVITVNLDHLRRFVRDDSYHQLCKRATLLVADGMPLVWASRIQGGPTLPERVAGSNLVWRFSAALAAKKRSLFLLGGDPGTAEAAAHVLAERYPGLQIAGTDCPVFGFERDPAAMASLRRKLREAKPDMIYVALGSPKQEVLIDQLRGEMPGTWWIGVGISFSFISGHVRRAPRWMQHTGLEWIHRLQQEPRRLARRYLVDGLPFGVDLLARAVGRRVLHYRPNPS